jgi:DNA gyrase subunit A
VLGRNTQGVRLINLDEKQEFVASLAVVDDEEKAGEEIH